MDALMLIILGIIIVACLLFGTYTILYNKVQDYVIRINEVESIIDNNLRNKYDFINKCVSIVKGTKELEDKINQKPIDEIVRLRTKKISNFDLDRKLVDAENIFIKMREEFLELKENKDINEYMKKIDDTNENLVVNKEYYNKNIAEYNKLITMFPTNIVAKIAKYQEKLFFDRKDMSDDDFEDFKL